VNSLRAGHWRAAAALLRCGQVPLLCPRPTQLHTFTTVSTRSRKPYSDTIDIIMRAAAIWSAIILLAAALAAFVTAKPRSFFIRQGSTTRNFVLHPNTTREQRVSLFTEAFTSLNKGPGPPYIVFRGSKQGLGNNLLSFASTVAFSVYVNVSFRYSWNSGGRLSDLSEIIDLPVEGLRVKSTHLPCEWNLACCAGESNSAKPPCWAALGCACINASVFEKCPQLMISSNIYWISVLQANPCFQERMNMFFPPGTTSIIGSLFQDRFLAPSAQAEAGVQKHLNSFKEWTPNGTLGVHLRSKFISVPAGIACINQTFTLGLYKYIFLATDAIIVRQQLSQMFGPRLLFINFTMTDLEHDDERDATVRTAWIEAVILSRLPNKLLSFPGSTFSHIIYSMSDPQSNVIDLTSCARHVGPFITFVEPPACTLTGNGSIGACKGRFPFRH
jgi:hypothetical protein